MDDLLDLSWQDKPINAHPAKASAAPARQNNPFSSLSNGLSASATPNRTATASPARQMPAAAADSFGGLVNFGKKPADELAGTSLAARAQALQAEKEAAQQQQAQLLDQHFGLARAAPGTNNPFKSATALPIVTQLQQTEPGFALRKTDTETTEELLAAINGERPEPQRYDSYFPPPPESPRPSSAVVTSRAATPAQETIQDDDDTFGVFAAANKKSNGKGKAKHVDEEEDDVLGSLGKPLEARPTPPPVTQAQALAQADSDSTDDDEQDDEDLRRAKQASLASARDYEHRARTGEPDWGVAAQDPRRPAIKQIVEMGFTPAQARVALANTDSGLDVAAAMDLLLQLQGQPVDAPQRIRPQQQQQGKPGQTQDANGDWVDSTYNMATKTFATANSWLTNKSAMARRKLAEYNASAMRAPEPDDRPRWMRDADRVERLDKGKAKAKADEEETWPREEGLPLHPAERRRLEANGVLPPSSNTASLSRRTSVESNRSGKSFAGSFKSLTHTVATTLVGIQPPSSQSQQQPSTMDSRRFKADDDEAAAYVSSRRRRPAPAVIEEDLYGAPSGSGSGSGSRAQASGSGSGGRAQTSSKNKAPISPVEEDLFGSSSQSSKGKGKASAQTQEVDLFGGSSVGDTGKGKGKGKTPAVAQVQEEEVDLFSPPKQPARPASQASQATARSTRPTPASRRSAPYLDASVLATALQNKTRGSEAFKRGDFTKALGFYDAALQPLPTGHLSRVSILSNRAWTHLQTGAPKLALQDCEEALAILGPSNGHGETMDENGTAVSLAGLWAKIMQRKATALEMQERHQDALLIWQVLVRSGQGGETAMQAKQRCEKVCAPKKAAPKLVKAVQKPAKPSGEGVAKLRAEAAVQDANELERQALLDVVGDKIAAWSKGKETNLRALLASVDQVLWPAANWKKVSLADLVLDGKVKVIYMKALAKVHPDKIPRDASVEQKMIAGAVFAKLNAAWDAFKKQTGQ